MSNRAIFFMRIFSYGFNKTEQIKSKKADIGNGGVRKTAGPKRLPQSACLARVNVVGSGIYRRYKASYLLKERALPHAANGALK
jgi:hypothetical protein